MSMEPRLAKPNEVAEYIGITEAALARTRYLGTGPAFLKLGRRVRYRWEDVIAWAESQTQTKSGVMA